MASYLNLLNLARNRQGQTDLSANAIVGNSGDALKGIQAIRKAVFVFLENSFDLDSKENVQTITTTVGASLLPAPTPSWDSNVIKGIKFKEPGNNYLRPLTLVTLEEAEDLKLKTYSGNEPVHWWVNNHNVYVLPVPTQAYQLTVFYRGMTNDITADNITDQIVLPTSASHALEDLTYAYLREQIGDPQWIQLEERAILSLKRFYQSNKYTYKRRGFRKVNIKPRTGDRRL